MKKLNSIRTIFAGSLMPQLNIKKGKSRVLLFTILALMALVGPRIAQSQTAVQTWVQRYNSSAGASADKPAGVVVDPSGDVIVAGNSDSRTTGSDWLIIKYSGAGVPLWTNRYNGPGNADDTANSIAVDSSGDVIVTGGSANSNVPPYNYDYTTIKYSSAGVPLWTNRFNGLANDNDYATAMVVDGSGNIFVTGNSGAYATTIKYSGAGIPSWTNHFGGGAVAMTLDASGDVLVTGNSSVGGYSDYMTIKYTRTGVPVWTNFYDGPLNGDDTPTALVVNGRGNVFVTGSSLGAFYYDANDEYTYYKYDYATVAYSGAGIALWTNRYSGSPDIFAFQYYDKPNAVAADGNGDVFVSGAVVVSDGSFDWATIKYSAAGVPLWTNRNRLGTAIALAVDGSGNVLVTGSLGASDDSSDYGTIKYSGAGVPLWTNRYNGPGNGADQSIAIALDSGGNVFVTGVSYLSAGRVNPDYATVAYSGGGVPLWTNRYNGPGNVDDRANAVAVSPSGNVFVTGSSIRSGSGYDYATVAYSGAGVPLWTNHYNGPGNGDDRASGLAVDASGNVFVTGFSFGTNAYPPNYDFATIKYSGTGVPLWTNRYGPGTGFGEAIAIAVDGSGNVFVTGSSDRVINDSDNADYATIKYSAAGVALWTNRYNGPGNYDDRPTAIALDSTGNVFVTGSSYGVASSYDYATIKYSAAGAPLWTNRYNGPNSGDYARAVAVDASGNVLVTGTSYGAGGSSSDWATVKYSATGMPWWTNRYNGPGNDFDEAYAVAADGSGNVFVTGYSVGSGSGADYATIKYSGAGVPLWTNRYNGLSNNNDFPVAVAVDISGNAFVTGSSDGLGNSADLVTIGYSSAGVPLWTNRYNGPANGYDSPEGLQQSKQSLALGPDGSVYVTGSSDGDYTGGDIRDFVTIKYSSNAGAPMLTITRSNAFVVISRPVIALGFQLQESTNLALPNTWSPVAQPAVTNGAQISVTVPAGVGPKFFRLKSQ